MTSSRVNETLVPVQDVRVTDKALEVILRDGRTLSVPLEWYPRLANETPRERQRWRLIGEGIGIQWPDLDEDISIAGLLWGLPSGESAQSLERWLASRRRPPPKKLLSATTKKTRVKGPRRSRG
jgi:hypothetical protein